MSRAFTKEDGAQLPFVVPRAPLPAGVTNYVTPRGLAALRAERAALEAARPAGDTDHQAVELAAHNARLAALDARIASALVVDPATLPHDEVRFSARVTLIGEHGSERSYRIVGIDEADPASGRITFVAPLARALMGKRVGDTVGLRSERGEEELEISGIAYDDD
jgi:transcription elongation factor GreB